MNSVHTTAKLSELDGRILRLVRDASTISRSELARRSGLSRPAVGARIESLLQLGLVRELGAGASTGGRPPSLIHFARDAGFVVGVDLGATSADVAITDLANTLRAHVAIELDVGDGPVKTLTVVCELLDRLLEDTAHTVTALRGIGIGLPAPVDYRAGVPVSPPIMPGWDQFPVRDFLTERYGCPVLVDNDANMMALGEGRAGVGMGVANFLYVKIGSGIGCGVVGDGVIYRGQNGSAGDIGHIAVSGQLSTCHCGNVGCLESIAGGRALGREARRLAAAGGSPELARALAAKGTLSALDLEAAIARADLAAVDIVRGAAAAIGEVLAGLVNFFNPSLVIIGGGVANIGDLLLAGIRESIYRRSMPLATRDLVVTGGALGGRAGVIGAAATVLAQLYLLTGSEPRGAA